MTFDAKGYMQTWAGFREMNTAAWAARENNDCNGSGPHTAGEVRVMPHSDAPLHGNDILCRACWQRALTDRRERNRSLGDFAQFALPAWETAEVYDTRPVRDRGPV